MENRRRQEEKVQEEAEEGEEASGGNNYNIYPSIYTHIMMVVGVCVPHPMSSSPYPIHPLHISTISKYAANVFTSSEDDSKPLPIPRSVFLFYLVLQIQFSGID